MSKNFDPLNPKWKRTTDAIRVQRSIVLSDAAKQVWRELTVYSWTSKGTSYPSQATLAENLGYSVSKVKRVIAELRARGMVETRRRNHQNYYVLSDPLPEDVCPLARVLNSQKRRIEFAATQCVEGVTSEPSRGHRRTFAAKTKGSPVNLQGVTSEPSRGHQRTFKGSPVNLQGVTIEPSKGYQ